MSSFHLDRFIELVRKSLPTDDDNVAHRMEVKPLIMNHTGPLAHRRPHFLVMKGEKPTNNWSEN